MHRKNSGPDTRTNQMLTGNMMMSPLPRKLLIASAFGLFVPIAMLGQTKDKAEKPAGITRLRIEVTGGEKAEPVENASVYVKYAQERILRKDKKFEMNLKTNRDGVAKSPEIRRGKVLVQVVAEGWKPFGRWYELDQDEQTIKIHLEKPPRWY